MGNPKLLSKAIDQIPLNGSVTKSITIMILLSLKRLDVFVCVDSKNKKRLCKAFGITQSSLSDSNNYWEDVVMRIQDAEWYQNSLPKSKKERKVENY